MHMPCKQKRPIVCVVPVGNGALLIVQHLVIRRYHSRRTVNHRCGDIPGDTHRRLAAKLVYFVTVRPLRGNLLDYHSKKTFYWRNFYRRGLCRCGFCRCGFCHCGFCFYRCGFCHHGFCCRCGFCHGDFCRCSCIVLFMGGLCSRKDEVPLPLTATSSSVMSIQIYEYSPDYTLDNYPNTLTTSWSYDYSTGNLTANWWEFKLE